VATTRLAGSYATVLVLVCAFVCFSLTLNNYVLALLHRPCGPSGTLEGCEWGWSPLAWLPCGHALFAGGRGSVGRLCKSLTLGVGGLLSYEQPSCHVLPTAYGPPLRAFSGLAWHLRNVDQT
jgi:hypothetical protein